MNNSSLEKIAKLMVAPSKGILAADESTGTIKKRLDSISVESNEINRRAYREMLFTAPEIEKYISAVILFDETLRQNSRSGKRLTEILQEKHIIPGIKVDKGTWPCPGYNEYPITQGLDQLKQRCDEYYELGAKFTKWRAVIKIINSFTPEEVIEANALTLALYASTAQESGLVPIVEPEVLMDGNHEIDICQKVTETTLKLVFDKLNQFNVNLNGIVLKPNMVLSGSDSNQEIDHSEVADKTLNILKGCVPKSVPGIAFLSGGQNEIEATENLNYINQTDNLPWEVTFSYGRALQQTALYKWKGEEKNVSVSQKAFIHRAKMNSLAHDGKYKSNLENQ
ncbi:MAG: Fructose-bisphosphate aldolase class 1 [Alphaproteobacteria bacterium MarineAlpha2_Bin1]|nr:MAG: Fructose-bisphosphate aldolase class 1 [Alphaproteobacteria bacterium MarineAlpha2_Bin1]